MSEGSRAPQYVAAIVSSIGALMAGITLGWSSPVEGEIKDGDLGFPVSDDEYSWVAGTLPLGAAFACIPTGFLTDLIGRKLTLCILPLAFASGWTLINFAPNVYVLYAGRIFLGIGCGAICASAPVYIGEIAQKEIRGVCGNFFQLLITFGVTLVYLMGAFIRFTPLNYFALTICIIQLVSMIFMPESPVYLIEKGKEERAQKSLEFLRGKNYDPKAELDATKAESAQRKANKKSFFQGFNNIACFRALYITLGLMFFQQFSGINAVIFYATAMFEAAGSSLEPRFSSLIIGAIGFFSTLVSGFFVDKLGRRLLLLLSAGFMALSTFVFGIYFFFLEKDESSVANLGWLPLATICIYYIMFSFGFGPVPWIMIGEVFPADVRGPAGSIAATSNWVFAFIVGKSYVSVKNFIGVGLTFFIFSCVCVIGVVFVFFLVIETKGKSLQEIQDELSKKKSDS